MTGLSRIWKLPTLRVCLNVSTPAPIRLIASFWRLVRESSWAGKLESKDCGENCLGKIIVGGNLPLVESG